ncbi:MAG: hypothetical protein WD176_02490 [Pirellulales bacterium]
MMIRDAMAAMCPRTGSTYDDEYSSSERMPARIAFVIGWVAALSAGAIGSRLAAAEPSRAGHAPVDEAEIRDAVLMLDGGPLRLRFRIALDGRSLSAIRDDYVSRLLQSLDADGDGKLTRKEARNSPLLAAKRRDSAAAFLDMLDENRLVERAEILQLVERVGGETVVYRQDLSAADNDLEVFRLLDADGSGLVDHHEMAGAGERITQRDQDGDECVSFDEFLPSSIEDPSVTIAVANAQVAVPPAPGFSDLLRDAGEPLLPRRLVRKYDADGDGKLSPDELNWNAQRIAIIDADGDGRLDPAELARLDQTDVDLEVAVDLAGGGSDGGRAALSVVQASGITNADRPDLARTELTGATINVSFRSIDPIQSAIDNAFAEFNRMDADASGYLDPPETSQRLRFERGLFDAIDADHDGKIFAEEMEAYIRLRTEPAAASCQVTLYDTGYGFFQLLDANSDGRISVREMRTARQSLAAVKTKSLDGLAPNDPLRHFHMEFVQGAFQLFGRPEQTAAQLQSFVTRMPIGPVWFQRMDRNGDGDLTWEEFLGPREAYYRLDADRDDLIDPQEAQRAEDG